MKTLDELHLSDAQLKKIQEMEDLVGSNYVQGTTKHIRLNHFARRYSNYPEDYLYSKALEVYEEIKDNIGENEPKRRYLAFLVLCLKYAIFDITNGLRRDYRDGIDENGHKIGSKYKPKKKPPEETLE